MIANENAEASIPGPPHTEHQSDENYQTVECEEIMSASPPQTPVRGDEDRGKSSTPSNQQKKRASKRLKTDDYNQNILDIAKQKLQYLTEKAVRKQGKDGDEDNLFFKTLLPHVKKIPDEMKLAFKGRIQEVVQEYAYPLRTVPPLPSIYTSRPSSSSSSAISTPHGSPYSYNSSPDQYQNYATDTSQ